MVGKSRVFVWVFGGWVGVLRVSVGVLWILVVCEERFGGLRVCGGAERDLGFGV